MLSQESGNHVKFLIKTKLSQKWLAFPPLLTPLGIVTGAQKVSLIHPLDSRLGRPKRERQGWQKEGESGPPGVPLDLQVIVSRTRTYRSGRNTGFCVSCVCYLWKAAAAVGDRACFLAVKATILSKATIDCSLS